MCSSPIYVSFNAAWDSPIPAYHFATLLVRSTATRYINCCTIHYISSTLHQQTMDSSLNDAPDSSKTPPKGSRVRIDGLQSAQDLNGAVGIVVDAVDAATGRIPVKLTGQAATSRPDGIKVKPANLSLLPPQRGVRLLGSKAAAVDLSAELLGVTTSKWRSCPVPKLLGIPLSLMQLAPTTHSTRVQWEQPAVLMLMDPKSGFAPPWVQWDGLGEVLLAREDGEDWTVDELWQLHDYNCSLLDRYSNWCEEGETKEVVAERAAALKPSAYANFVARRAKEQQEDEDEEDEEDFDEEEVA